MANWIYDNIVITIFAIVVVIIGFIYGMDIFDD